MISISSLAIATALAGALLLAAQELPDGPGKEIVSARCTGCHAVDTIVSQHLDRKAWSSVIAKMTEKGARLDDQEREKALDYLAINFGPRPKSPIDPAVERTARRYIDGICSSCHGSDLIAGTRGTKDMWLDIVSRMNGKGAGLSEADVELLANYLARTYPPE